MTFKTLEEANELLQKLGDKPEIIGQKFNGCTAKYSTYPPVVITDKDGYPGYVDCLVISTGLTDGYPARMHTMKDWEITALPEKDLTPSREQLQTRINEINANKADRIEKGRSESNEKKRLQRQLDALPRFEVGCVYRPQQDYRTVKTHIAYIYMGLCSDRFFTFLLSEEGDGIFLPEMRQINGSEVDRIEFTKIADQDDRNLQWLLDGKWDEKP